MTGFVESTTYKKQTKKYVTSTSLIEILDSSTFVKDFINHMFIHAEFNSQDNFNFRVYIITPSSPICISPQFLKRIYSFTDYTLLFILDLLEKY